MKIGRRQQSAGSGKKLQFVVCALWAVLSAPCSSIEAQQTKGLFRIGYLSVLSPPSDSARFEAFVQGLLALGYVGDRTIIIEARYAEGKLARLPELAAELAAARLDVIVAGGSTAIRAMKNATKVVPIVMAHGSDPVELGYVASLARPRGNITSLTHMAPELGSKRLELVKEMGCRAFPSQF